MSKDDQIKVLNRKQGSIKAKLTSLRRFVDGFPLPDPTSLGTEAEIAALRVSAIQVDTRLQSSRSYLDEFNQYYDQLIEIEEEENLLRRHEEYAAFETQFFQVIASATELANSIKRHLSSLDLAHQTNGLAQAQSVSQNSNTQQPILAQVQVQTQNVNQNSSTQAPIVPPSAVGSSASSSTSASNVPIHLPILNVQKFEGQCELFNTFFESFKSLIHNNDKLPNMSKFLYLRNCLGVEPMRVIEHVDLLDENYEVALALLEKRYRDTKLMIHNHIKGIVDCPPVGKNNGSLQILSDLVQSHLRALETLGEPINSWASLIQYIVINKLDYNGKREWEVATLGNDRPTLDDLFEYLEKRCRLLVKISKATDNPIVSNFQSKSHQFNSRFNSNRIKNQHQTLIAQDQHIACYVCKGNHTVYNCSVLLGKSVPQRIAEVKRLKLCENCLRFGHNKSNCRSQHCRKCSEFHSTLLHLSNTPSEVDSSNQTTAAVGLEASRGHVNILPTAEILIFDSEGQSHNCIALLDSASQRSYITSALCHRLRIPISKLQDSIRICGINDSRGLVSDTCSATIKSLHTNFSATLSLIVLRNITSKLSYDNVDAKLLTFPSRIELANPKFREDTRIDLLLGVEIFWEALSVHQPRLHPLLHNTQFGFVVSGSIRTKHHDGFQESHISAISIADISKQLNKFWEIEKVDSLEKRLSPEEIQCETNFIQTTKRDVNGRFIVKMPLCAAPSVLGQSKERALRQFKSLEKRLQVNSNLKTMYINFMQEYEALGHMTQVNSDCESPSYYLPHHGVLKDESLTTKLRVVFNSSSPTSNGISLNDIQMNGPVIQDDLFSILVRFRRFQYVLTADCSKMYRCILMSQEQRSLQRIFWRSSPSEPIKTYELNTVTYGQKCSSFLAIRCLFELASECESEHPLISKTIRKSMYCDDLITCCRDLDEASYIFSNITTVLASGGFILRKWNSNDQSLLRSAQTSNIPNNVLAFGPNESTKTLGLIFNSFSDNFYYKLSPPQFKSKPTKRLILSFMSSIFDPLGLISPCVTFLKVFMQRLWSTQSSWDEPLCFEMEKAWNKYSNELLSINTLQIGRQAICSNHGSLEIHAFSDASEKAYGSCVYLRSIDRHNNVFSHLLCSKTKVAPLKTITIPKLELCAALMMAQLVDRIKLDLDLNITNTFLWTDSQIVLSWIQTQPCFLNTFVSNRVSQIQDLSDIQQWRYVSTKGSPADILSRGANPEMLKDMSLWWHGPDFLTSNKSMTWPDQPIIPTNKDLPELKSTRVFVSIQPKNCIFPFEKYSKLSKMQVIMAYCLRFISNCRSDRSKRNFGPLSYIELNQALTELAKLSQYESFPDEIESVKKGKDLPRKSKLISLSPFLCDDKNVLRIRGRLSNSKFEYEKRHPIVISVKHHFTKALFEYYHKTLLHAGPQQMLYTVRERFWPIGGRNLSKKVFRACLKCFRVNPKPASNLMGDLPTDRVSTNFPFMTVGIDYCGPFILKESGMTRKFRTFKCYVCLFICFSTKAIHLEPVLDLTTEAFISTLRAFSSRRGMPSKIYSDNGRNFVGAKTELHKLGQFLVDNHEYLVSSCARENFQWIFLPPYAPNMAGIWEAGVKSSKTHLKRVIGDSILTLTSFTHVLAQIEGVLNSRPLTPMSSEPTDFQPLTPAHFLIGRPLTTVPDPSVIDVKENRLSKHQKLQLLVQSFWRRWSKEYVSELQQRVKWRNSSKNLRVGQLVILKEDNIPPCKWKMGRVIELHPGNDGIVRVVSIKLGDGMTRRSLSKICPLPDQNGPED